MKEIVFDSFKSTLQEVKILNNIIEKEKVNKSELEKSLKQAQHLLFSSYSSLSIFAEIVESYVCNGHKFSLTKKQTKKKLSETEVKIIYNKLLSLINEYSFIGLIELNEDLSLVNDLAFFGHFLRMASIDEDIIKLNDTLNIGNLSKNELSDILLKYLNAIKLYIQDILLNNIFLIFEKPKVNSESKFMAFRDYKKEYIDKWLNCTVELSDYRLRKRMDHWVEIFKLDLDFEQTEKIENHQKKLFNEWIQGEVLRSIDDFDELEVEIKKEALKKEIALIQEFFNSNTSKVVVKRLNNILNFSDPEEILVEYDDILRDRLSLNDFNVCKAGKSDYSNAFVASFFMQYLVALKNELKNTTTQNVSDDKEINDFKKVITNKAKREYVYNILEHFGAINSARKAVLTQRKKGVLRGVVEALMDNNILPELGLHKLCLIIAKDINLELNSKLDYHDTAKKIHKQAQQYIKDNPLH